MDASMQTEESRDNSPPWRSSHTAASPDGLVVAAIEQAFEHSMGNPTMGTLRTSNGLVLPKCSPAFIWSSDSRYLAVPQWCRRFGLFRRQRLAIMDAVDRVVYVSPFTHWLLQPAAFERGRLEVLVSDWRGISWPWKDRPLILEVPSILSTFGKLNGVDDQAGRRAATE
jgi:hypothetical protein